MYYLSLFVSFTVLIASISSVSDFPKLIVVSFDGFRYDYLNRDLTPNLNALKPAGSYGKHVLSVFPTQTFPNHFSIATGMYAEVHGVLASRVYDQQKGVMLNYSYSLFHYNEDILPIWTLNELAGGGRHSGVMMWPGSNFVYQGINATFVTEYDVKFDWKLRVDTVIGWLEHPETPANLVMMYFEEPDRHTHAFGPDSSETNYQIKRADKITKYLLDQLDGRGLNDVHLIVLSDHGIDQVFKKNIIDLRPLIGNECGMYGSSPVLQVHPKLGVDVDDMYKRLSELALRNKTFKVYKTVDIPNHFHYKNCGRAPPILVVAEPEYVFQDMYESMKKYKRNFNASEDNTFGEHGYDPLLRAMQPFFIATGPLFKRNYTVEHKIGLVDMYIVFSRVLNLGLPPVTPNSTYDRVADIFVSPITSFDTIIYWTFSIILGIMIIKLIY